MPFTTDVSTVDYDSLKSIEWTYRYNERNSNGTNLTGSYDTYYGDYQPTDQAAEAVISGLAVSVSGFGFVTNIINIIVFYRQGILSDSCTATLATLAISDLSANSLSLTMASLTLSTHLDSIGIFRHDNRFIIANLLATPYPLFTLYTCFTTAHLAFERMICVTFPFRVRDIFTPSRTVLINLVIFCVLFITMFPCMAMHKLRREKMGSSIILGLQASGIISYNWFRISLELNLIYLRLASIVLVIVFNIVVAVRVILSYRFRKTSTSMSNSAITATRNTEVNKKGDTKGDKKGSKEVKLVKMVSLLCAMLVVSYIPFVTNVVSTRSNHTSPMLPIAGQFLETLNSSCNIVVYFFMSTKYKKELVGLCSGSCKN